MCGLFRAEGCKYVCVSEKFDNHLVLLVRQSLPDESRSFRGASRIRHTLRRGWVDPYHKEPGADRRRRKI